MENLARKAWKWSVSAFREKVQQKDNKHRPLCQGAESVEPFLSFFFPSLFKKREKI
jgi:hypothetical protein